MGGSRRRTTFREYLRWVEGQSAEGTRVIETVLPETDDDAVRILTIHGAKGLEFPIVVLSGLTTAMRSQSRGVEVRFPPSAGWAIKLSKRMATSDFELNQPVDEQMDRDERLRLLYVAATRARDHLVVSVHRKAGTRATPTSAEVLYQAGWNPKTVELLDVATERPAVAPAPDQDAGPGFADLPTLEGWRSPHDASTSLSVATSRHISDSTRR